MEGGGRGGFHLISRVQEAAAEVDEGLAALVCGQLTQDRSADVFADFEQRLIVRLVLVGGLVEEGVELVELLLRDRVVLVRVALGAADGQPHPDLSGRGDAVLDGGVAKLLVVGAALGVGHRVAVEAGGDELILRGHGQQVACQLQDSEAVERHVGVQRPDHPVAVRPDGAQSVLLIALGIGIAGQIQPDACPALPEVGRVEQLVHDLFVSFRGIVFEERLHQFRLRRQPGEIERYTANQRVAVGLLRWLQPLFFQTRQYEMIDRVARPTRVGNGGRIHPHGRLERPVPVVLRAVVNPLFEQFDLTRAEPLAVGRHGVLLGLGSDDDAAVGCVAGRDAGVTAGLAGGVLERIQPQVRLAGVLVAAVAGQTLLEHHPPPQSPRLFSRPPPPHPPPPARAGPGPRGARRAVRAWTGRCLLWCGCDAPLG